MGDSPHGHASEEGGARQGTGSAISARIRRQKKFFNAREEKTDGC
jgi:hypothetical protein